MTLSEMVCTVLADLFREKLPLVMDRFHDLKEVSQEEFWRMRFLAAERAYEKYYRDKVALRGKKVLDVGCGLSAPTVSLALKGTSYIVGTDVDFEVIERGRDFIQSHYPELSQGLGFAVCGDKTLPFASNCFDLVFMTDTFEHLMHPREVLSEIKRVLKVGGLACIDFAPWGHPKGHHLGQLVPIPWAHFLFPERTLLKVAASVYDSPKFKPIFWHYDYHTGAKKPNRWAQASTLPDINKLSLRDFEKLLRESGMEIVYYHLYDHTDSDRRLVSKAAWLLKPLFLFPPLREFLTRRVVCILRKGDEA